MSARGSFGSALLLVVVAARAVSSAGGGLVESAMRVGPKSGVLQREGRFEDEKRGSAAESRSLVDSWMFARREVRNALREKILCQLFILYLCNCHSAPKVLSQFKHVGALGIPANGSGAQKQKSAQFKIIEGPTSRSLKPWNPITHCRRIGTRFGN